MAARISTDCTAFLEQLRGVPGDSTCSDLQNILDKHQRKAWIAAFAWSILVCVASHEALPKHGDMLARVAWKACELVHCHERRLTLRKFDFDKLLSNLAGKFLDAKLFTWTCCFASLLHERLRMQSPEGPNLSDLFAGLCLGRDFLKQVPLFPVEGRDKLAVRLVLNCQCYWLRLYFVSPSSFSLEGLAKLIFDPCGILSCIRADPQASFELFAKSWRLGLLSSTFPEQLELYRMERDYFEEMTSTHVDDGFLMLKWRNIASYLARFGSQNLELLWNVAFTESSLADRMMSDLEPMPKEALLGLVETTALPAGDVATIKLLLVVKHGVDCFGDDPGPARLGLSLAGERALCRVIGHALAAVERGEHLVRILLFLNTLSEATLKLLEGVLRALSRSGQRVDADVLATFAKRMIKLGGHFGKLDAVQTSLVNAAKEFALLGRRVEAETAVHLVESTMEETVVEKCIEFWIFLYRRCSALFPLPQDIPISRRMDIVLETVRMLPAKARESSRLLWGICVRSTDFKVIVACHAARLRTKALPMEALQWHGLIQDDSSRVIDGILRTCLLLLWSYHAQLDYSCILGEMTTSKVELSVDIGADERDIYRRTLLLLKMFDCNVPQCWQDSVGTAAPCPGTGIEQQYLEDSLYSAYGRAREEFEATLTAIKSSSHEHLWQHYCTLFDVVDWLIFLSQVGCAHKLARYYVKAGMAYCDSLQMGPRKSKYVTMQERTEAPWAPQVLGLDGPSTRINDLVGSLETQIVQIEEETRTVPTQKFRFYRQEEEEGRSETDLPHRTLLESCWRHGGPFLFRRLVCTLIAHAVGDPRVVLGLIEMAKELELRDLDAPGEGGDGSFGAHFSQALSSPGVGPTPTVSLFLDAKREILYLGSYASAVCMGRPSVLAIFLDGAYRETSQQVHSIVEDNKKMLFDPKSTSSVSSADEMAKRAWWQGRFELQKRLEAVISTIDQWLAPLRLFLQAATSEQPRIAGEFSSLRGKMVGPAAISVPVLFKALGADTSMGQSMQRELVMAMGFDEEDSQTMVRSADRHLQRIVDDDQNPFCSAAKVRSNTKTLMSVAVDRHVHELPLEACAVFGDHLLVRSFSSSAAGALEQPLEASSIAAILNPGGDLVRTEEQLRPLLASLRPAHLVCGRTPSKDEMRSCLSTAHLSLYFGHGSGEAYLSNAEVCKIRPCASVFLFGCSSGRLKHSSPWSPEGALLAYRTAKSRIVIANLWDVTDRDIDKLSVDFLTLLDIVGRKQFTLEECSLALGTSRASCLLRILNGSAPVIYIN